MTSEKDHLVLGQRARLIREEYIDLPKILIQIGRINLTRLIGFLII